MSRTLKIAVVLGLLALMPLRAMASVTVGFCALAQHHSMAQAGATHDHGSSHGSAPHPHGSGDDHCNACAEHCANASCVVAAELLPLLATAAFERPALGDSFAASFVPDQLDPPPLAL